MGINIETIKTASAPTEIQYFRFGSGNSTMVILPGLSLKSVMDSAEFIAAAYSMFADKFTVYVFNIRNDITDRITPEDIAEDTVEAMKAAGLSDIYLFGVSLGGIISQKIAEKEPGLIRKLALCSTAESLPAKTQEFFGELVSAAEKGNASEVMIRFAEAVYSEELLRKSRTAIEDIAAIVTESDLKRFIFTVRGMLGFETHIGEYDLPFPVLVTGGAKDKIISGEALRKLADDTKAELFIYEQGAHSIYDEIPDHKQRLLKFFTEIK